METVGRYRLLKRLAAGGMGEIYLAAQSGPEGFTRVVALKRMLPTVSAEHALVRHFLDEARLVATLSHRNIAQIYDFGQDRDGYFVAMEYVQGASLYTLIDRLGAKGQRLPPALAADIASQVADALGYAYSARGVDGKPLCIVHRDVTPQNILVSVAGDVKLIDFGVAKSAQQQHSTQDGAVKGKFGYMSPEHSRGDATLDGRSDLFSLGVVLCEMLTGKNPFERDDLFQTVLAIQLHPAHLPSETDPSLAVFDEVLGKLLAKARAERFADGHQASEELAALRLRLPRPNQRLGALVTELFGSEIEEQVRSLSDPVAQRALDIAPPVPAGPPSGLTPRTEKHVPTGEVAAPPVPTVGSARPVVPPPTPDEIAPTTMRPSQFRIPVSKRRLPAAAIGFAVLVAVVGSLYFLGRAPPDHAPASESPAPAPQAPNPPAPLPPPPALGASPIPATPSPVAQPAPGPSAPQATSENAKPAPNPRPKPATRPNRTAGGAKARVEAATPARSPGPTTTPAPAEPVYQAVVLGGQGELRIPLAGSSGLARLFKSGDLTVSLSYRDSGGDLDLTLQADPWAIVTIGGVPKGRTPVGLPSATSSPLRIELRSVGATEAFVLRVERGSR